MNSKLSSADGRSRWRRRRRLSQDLLLHAQHPVLPAQADQLVPLGRGQALLVALVDVGLGQPGAQAAFADADVGRDLGDRLGPFTGQLDGPTPELRRMRRWHTDSFPEVLPPQCRCPANRGMLTARDHLSEGTFRRIRAPRSDAAASMRRHSESEEASRLRIIGPGRGRSPGAGQESGVCAQA